MRRNEASYMDKAIKISVWENLRKHRLIAVLGKKVGCFRLTVRKGDFNETNAFVYYRIFSSLGGSRCND